MKKILACLLLLAAFVTKAQVYNNEWIDHNKTYYKFKVGKDGVYRIPQSVLTSAGLGTTPAQYFQLWRNGVQVPVYTSVATGGFSPADYIEFWGVLNDGKVDKSLYRNTDYQLNDKWSLQTDTSTYFLTVNPAGNNLRLMQTVNNVAGNNLPAEPYFMHTAGNYFRDRIIRDTLIGSQLKNDTLLNTPMQALPRLNKDIYTYRINPGYAVNVGEYLYSSSYDKGEGFTSQNIPNGGSITATLKDLFIYPSGPAPFFRIAASGNAINTRQYKAEINGTTVLQNNVDYFNYTRDSANFSINTLSTNKAIVRITNTGTTANDRMVVHKYEVVYPREFDFGGASNFEFSLPAGSNGNYLEIKSFSYGAVAPVLYDLTNGKRYVSDIANPSIIKIVLGPSATPRSLVLVSQDAANTNTISALQSRTFVNYSLPSNSGNYLIVTNAVLMNGANGANPVEEYRAYRGTTEGGAFNAKTYLVEDLVDQFGFGIKKHPVAIRNFFMYARAKFSVQVKHFFLIGKGIHYVHHRENELNPDLDKLNFVPTFGWPASDMLLSAEPGDSYPKTPIGRLSVINANEVSLYLKKVKEHELAQRTPSANISDKAWMKNVVHIVGASEPALQAILDNYMNSYTNIIKDTSFGANVTTFTKSSPNSVEQVSSGEMDRLFEAGISLITYFGHSSSSTLEFNLNNPDLYNNQGKYPMFIGLGCNAGNFYNFNIARLTAKETLSEKFVLAPDRGTIGFIASSHFGIVHYLDISNTRQYRSISYKDYGKPIGEIMQRTIAEVFDFSTQEDFYARAQSEETSLHGDPAITLNPHPKPDYVIEESLVKINPAFVSVADNSFKLSAKFLNIGKALNQQIVVEVKQEYPDRSVGIIYRDTIPGTRYSDSFFVDIPIVASRDKGSNKITVTIDADNAADELYETNNSFTKEVFIYQDEARPIQPQNLSIVSQQNIKLKVSTANPFAPVKQYRMEIDTSELFAAPLNTATVSAPAGLIEFDPGIQFADSTVYYWRIAPVPTSGSIVWNTASFIYLPQHDPGFNQSHLYQHFKSSLQKEVLDSIGRFTYKGTQQQLFIRNGVYPNTSTQNAFYYGYINGQPVLGPGCNYNEIIFNVLDPNTFNPLKNVYSGGSGSFGSNASCASDRIYNFMYLLNSSTNRKKAMDFLDWIPNGSYVVVRGNVHPDSISNTYPDKWKADEALFGTGNSLYHRLTNSGFSNIDSFNRPRAWAFVFKKNNPSVFTPVSTFSENTFDGLTLSTTCSTLDTLGFVTSPLIGPALAWNNLKWNGNSAEASTKDEIKLKVVGIKNNGSPDTLYTINTSITDFDLSSIDSKEYPYLKLHLESKDTANYTPYQLQYWRVSYNPAPEGAIIPSALFSVPDSLEIGQPADFKLAFKNISPVNFDSLRVKIVLLDQNNVSHVLLNEKRRPLPANDTLHINYHYNNRQHAGVNSLYMQFNPDTDQPEQHHFNNFIYHRLYIKGDTLSPLLDVTFDNDHILNGDVVSSKPNILIKLKDEARWMLVDDTSLATVQIKYPDENGQLSQNSIVRTYSWNSDTLKFNSPATQIPNTNNTATIEFNPYFAQDGDYELIVKGKDKSSNKAGAIDYRVAFQVINKAMISNMLNYPNPFTTSTAFVFTITGAEVPQNLKIQILTVTGKIVREITKDELGPLRIGRNITDYKWDGTDQYGQKLGNGVYIYRVVTNLNGKSLEQYRGKDDTTDKYFNKGYGKMYLMR